MFGNCGIFHFSSTLQFKRLGFALGAADEAKRIKEYSSNTVQLVGLSLYFFYLVCSTASENVFLSISTQREFKSACAFAQSDQNPHLAHFA